MSSLKDEVLFEKAFRLDEIETNLKKRIFKLELVIDFFKECRDEYERGQLQHVKKELEFLRGILYDRK